jgi:hypothetical protein
MIYFVADFEFESSYENVDISQPPKQWNVFPGWFRCYFHIYIYTYFLLISGFTTFLFFLNCKKNRANLWISHQNMFFPWLIVLSLFGSLFFRRFFQGDFRFYMDSNADVRRKVEEFLGFGEGLNGKWMVSNFLIFVYIYIYIHIYIHDVCRICKCIYTYIYIDVQHSTYIYIKAICGV